MLFYYTKVPENFDSHFKVNDIERWNDGFILLRDSLFFDLVENKEVRTYFLPIWENKSHYWDFVKVFDSKDLYLLVINLEKNFLKLIKLNPDLSFDFIYEVRKEILNICSDFIFCSDGIYKFEKEKFIEIISGLDYYEEIKTLKNASVPVFIKIDDSFFYLHSIKNSNYLLNVYKRIKTIELKNFVKKDIDIFDFVENDFRLVFLEGINKIMIFAISNSNNLLRKIVLDNGENVSVQDLMINRDFWLKFILSDNFRIKKFNDGFVVLFIFKDLNELYFTKDFNDFQLISKNSNLVKVKNETINIVYDNSFIKILKLIEDKIELVYEENIEKIRKNESVLHEFIDYQSKKRKLISEFINNLKIVDFKIMDDKYIFNFNYLTSFFVVIIGKNQREMELIGSQNKSFSTNAKIDETLFLEFDINIDAEKILLLQKKDDTIFFVVKGERNIDFFIKNTEVLLNYTLIDIKDVAFNDFLTLFLESENLVIINKEGEVEKLLELNNKALKIGNVSDGFWIFLKEGVMIKLNNQNFDTIETKINLSISDHFGVYKNKIIYFNGVDSLGLEFESKGGFLYTKVQPIPVESINFYNKDGKFYCLVDNDAELIME